MPPGPRKLRDSCDSCHVAKVKCIKDSASCLRCATSGTACSFSPSDRRGKPRGAKNKVNRIPNVKVAPKSNLDPPLPQKSCRNDDLLMKTFSLEHIMDFPADQFLTEDWLGPTIGDCSSDLQMSYKPQLTTSDPSKDWVTIDPNMPSAISAGTQQTIPPEVPTSEYPDPMATMMPPFPSQSVEEESNDSCPHTNSPTIYQMEACSCYPINLQSLYALHCQANSTPANSTIPFDAALFINNKAISRCHAMLGCSTCVLSGRGQKSITSMFMLAGVMDDILVSYNSTFLPYLDDPSESSLNLSVNFRSPKDPSSSAHSMVNNISTPMTICTGFGVSRHHDSNAFRSHTISADYSPSSTLSSPSDALHSMKAASSQPSLSSSSSPASSSICTTPTRSSSLSQQLSLGSYCVSGEDGRHLKLEILKIELRKVERLWFAYRDTCALQKFEDDQKDLYAAVVCYLAKKLRSTSQTLDSMRRARQTW